jgi:polyferredoxin
MALRPTLFGWFTFIHIFYFIKNNTSLKKDSKEGDIIHDKILIFRFGFSKSTATNQLVFQKNHFSYTQ